MTSKDDIERFVSWKFLHPWLIVSADIVIISIYFGVFCLLQIFRSLIRISKVSNKYHLHLRYLASYLVYGSEGVVQVYSRKIRISETNLLIVGLVGAWDSYVIFYFEDKNCMRLVHLSNFQIVLLIKSLYKGGYRTVTVQMTIHDALSSARLESLHGPSSREVNLACIAGSKTMPSRHACETLPPGPHSFPSLPEDFHPLSHRSWLITIC
jgi:hypothetical protein